jgi:hypothetical protein
MAGDKTWLGVGGLGVLAVTAIGYLRPTNQAANAAAEAAQAHADSLAAITTMPVDTSAHAAHDSTAFNISDSTGISFDPKQIKTERDSLAQVIKDLQTGKTTLQLDSAALELQKSHVDSLKTKKTTGHGLTQ